MENPHIDDTITASLGRVRLTRLTVNVQARLRMPRPTPLARPATGLATGLATEPGAGLGPAPEDHRVHLYLILDGRARLGEESPVDALCPGDLAVAASGRRHWLTASADLRVLAVDFPAALVAVAPDRARLLDGASWSGTAGSGVLLSQVLTSLASHLPEIDPRTSAPLGESLACLSAPLFAEWTGPTAEDRYPERQELLLRVQAFIRENLTCPQLSPEVLARRHHVSLRYLQKIFEEHGGSPAKWIREERLARCSAELRDPRFAHLSVAAVGQRSGLYRASHLSQLFRAHYGVTPSEYRNAAVETGS